MVAACGHEVLVAKARKLRLIYQNDRKSDRLDAASLAQLGRLDPTLLAPIRHRGETAQRLWNARGDCVARSLEEVEL